MKMKTRYCSMIVLMLLSACRLTAQNAIYVYRNDGQFNAFYREDIDSITYSQLDTDSVLHDTYVTQEIHTSDSIYRIPVNAIDSIGFRQPETIYEKDVVKLTGELLEYLDSVQNLTLYFSPHMPYRLLPQKGDKLATTESTDLLPLGFLGIVSEIIENGKNYTVNCDSLNIDQAVSKFFTIYSVSNEEQVSERKNVKKEDYVERNVSYDLPVPRSIPIKLDFSSMIGESHLSKAIKEADKEDILSFDTAKGTGMTLEGELKPKINIDITLGINKEEMLCNVKMKMVSTWDLHVDFKKNGMFTLEKSIKLTPRSDFMAGYVPVHLEPGLKFEAKIDGGFGFSYDKSIRSTLNMSYSPPFINSIPVKTNNTIKHDLENHPSNATWKAILIDGEMKGGLYVEAGIGHSLLWAGIRVEGGVKLETHLEVPFNINTWDTASEETTFYDKYKDAFFLNFGPYVGVYFVAHAGTKTPSHDNFWSSLSGTFEWGKDFDLFGKKFYEGYLFPSYKLKESTMKNNSWGIKTELERNCLIPLSIGYTLFDKDDKKTETIYYPEKFGTPLGKRNFDDYMMAFQNIDENKKYTAYPIFKFLNKEILARPKITPSICPEGPHPHMIDLGLPSGRLWVCRNVGAEVPEDSGNYYAWGELDAKNNYDEQNYQYYDKKNFEYVYLGSNICGTRYDVSTKREDASCRMPDTNDLEELFNWCEMREYTLNSVKGILFEGKNGNKIFFPLAGDMHGNQLTGEGQYGYYWTGTQTPGYDFGAYNLFLTDKPTATRNYGHRHLGRTVRPVCDTPKTDRN